jgi:hypothetical protein
MTGGALWGVWDGGGVEFTATSGGTGPERMAGAR